LNLNSSTNVENVGSEKFEGFINTVLSDMVIGGDLNLRNQKMIPLIYITNIFGGG
jgi:hypothetical protein